MAEASERSDVKTLAFAGTRRFKDAELVHDFGSDGCGMRTTRQGEESEAFLAWTGPFRAMPGPFGLVCPGCNDLCRLPAGIEQGEVFWVKK